MTLNDLQDQRRSLGMQKTTNCLHIDQAAI